MCNWWCNQSSQWSTGKIGGAISLISSGIISGKISIIDGIIVLMGGLIILIDGLIFLVGGLISLIGHVSV